MTDTPQSILDEITSEVSQLSDEEIAKAAAAIQERNQKARARMTPDTKQRMKDREKKRRLLAKEILRVAKEKGLTAQVQADQAAAGQ